MSRRDAPIAYAPAKDWWASQENLLVKDQDGETLMYFPLQFLRQGHVLTFTYVKEQCESAFEEGGVLLRIDGSRIADTDAVTAGQIVYAIDGKWRRSLQCESGQLQLCIVTASECAAL